MAAAIAGIIPGLRVHPRPRRTNGYVQRDSLPERTRRPSKDFIARSPPAEVAPETSPQDAARRSPRKGRPPLPTAARHDRQTPPATADSGSRYATPDVTPGRRSIARKRPSSQDSPKPYVVGEATWNRARSKHSLGGGRPPSVDTTPCLTDRGTPPSSRVSPTLENLEDPKGPEEIFEPLQWAGTPVMKVTQEGHAECRVRQVRDKRRASSLREPARIVRTLEIEPIRRCGSLEPSGKADQVIRVSEQTYKGYGGDLFELQRRKPSVPAQLASDETLPELKLSFKSAFKLKCTAEGYYDYSWKGNCDVDRIRVKSDMDTVLNQVWVEDQPRRHPRSPVAEGKEHRDSLPPIRQRSLSERPGSRTQRAGSKEFRPSTRRTKSLGPGSERYGIDEPVQEPFAVPEILYLTSPNNMQRFSGRYDIVKDQLPNGHPLWKQRGSDRFLFGGRTGRWYLGGARERDVGFECSKGAIRSLFAHKGRQMPSDPRVTWQANVHGGWEGDVAIKFTTAPPEQHSKSLQVICPDAESDCEGIYEHFGEWANGFPLWKQRAGGCWFFSGSDGRWHVGRHEKKAEKFQVKEGYDEYGLIRSVAVHRGVPPDNLRGEWEYADNEGCWNTSPAIKVCVYVDTRSEATELPFYEG